MSAPMIFLDSRSRLCSQTLWTGSRPVHRIAEKRTGSGLNIGSACPNVPIMVHLSRGNMRISDSMTIKVTGGDSACRPDVRSTWRQRIRADRTGNHQAQVPTDCKPSSDVTQPNRACLTRPKAVLTGSRAMPAGFRSPRMAGCRRVSLPFRLTQIPLIPAFCAPAMSLLRLSPTIHVLSGPASASRSACSKKCGCGLANPMSLETRTS